MRINFKIKSEAIGFKTKKELLSFENLVIKALIEDGFMQEIHESNLDPFKIKLFVKTNHENWKPSKYLELDFIYDYTLSHYKKLREPGKKLNKIEKRDPTHPLIKLVNKFDKKNVNLSKLLLDVHELYSHGEKVPIRGKDYYLVQDLKLKSKSITETNRLKIIKELEELRDTLTSCLASNIYSFRNTQSIGTIKTPKNLRDFNFSNLEWNEKPKRLSILLTREVFSSRVFRRDDLFHGNGDSKYSVCHYRKCSYIFTQTDPRQKYCNLDPASRSCRDKNNNNIKRINKKRGRVNT
ncbi:MAG: hypothetical protein R3213_00870 [Flavobacteriaceae bacterium]|nr:hypothetical protein [Flavobacteriaceae bacterium]